MVRKRAEIVPQFGKMEAIGINQVSRHDIAQAALFGARRHCELAKGSRCPVARTGRKLQLGHDRDRAFRAGRQRSDSTPGRRIRSHGKGRCKAVRKEFAPFHRTQADTSFSILQID